MLCADVCLCGQPLLIYLLCTDYSTSASGRIASIIVLSSMVCSPIFGFAVDRLGKRVLVMLVGLLPLAPTFIALAFLIWNPIPWIIVLGNNSIGVLYSLTPNSSQKEWVIAWCRLRFGLVCHWLYQKIRYANNQFF